MTQSVCAMWLVRARRGTRKRCAALFVIGICAALMVFTMPFVTAPVGGAVEVMAVPVPLMSSAGGNASVVANMEPKGDVSAAPPAAASTANPPPSPAPLNLVPEKPSPQDNATDDAVHGSTSEKAKTMRAAVAASTTHAPVTAVAKSAAPVVTVAKSAAPVAAASKSVALPRNSSAAATSEKTAIVANASRGALPDSSSSAPSTSTTTTAAGASPITAPPSADAFHREPLDADALARLPIIYVITPTFPRVEQIPELTRLGQTLMHVPKLHWIVADDAPKKSPDVDALLLRTGLNYTYILGAMPESYRKKKGNKPKGVANRMAGLQWIRDNANTNGVMFLADDDNSYDIRLFDEMRYTKKVSMWPVGLITHLGVSTPVVRGGKVVDFYDGWIATRKFPVDMAGFAVNVGFLKSRPNATMPFKAGYEEDGFLRSLNITLDEIEPKADSCTKIYVWHTKTVTNKPAQKLSDKDRKKFNNTNLLAIPNIV